MASPVGISRLSISRLGIALCCVSLIIITIVWSYQDALHLRRPELISGYLLLGTMLLPALSSLRKKLSVLPLGTMAFWTRLHVALGFTLVPLYWVHVGVFWPDGTYEQFLAGLFYFVTFSGVVGWLVQARFPHRLTQTGREIQFERIPNALVNCRQEVEKTLLEYQQKTGNDTLARHYIDSLSWYFFKPRFLVNHLFDGESHDYWLRGKFRAIERYLNSSEQPYLENLKSLAADKGILDYHYTLQGTIKLWLFIHIPATAALLVLAFWHLALVHIYSV